MTTVVTGGNSGDEIAVTGYQAAVCPAAEPYVIGGGADADVGGGSLALSAPLHAFVANDGGIAGNSTVTVVGSGATLFADGETIIIGTGADQETATIKSGAPGIGTWTLDAPLANNHAVGETVDGPGWMAKAAGGGDIIVWALCSQ